MSTLYQVLGLSPGASEQQIKSTYRTLAMQFHPDVNAGDEASAQRFKEVSSAYETLGDPEARVAYDRALVCRRVETRQRYWLFAATAAATFVLTTGSLSLAVRWSQNAAVPQSEVQRSPGMENSQDALAQHTAAPQSENSRDPLAQHVAAPQSDLQGSPGMETPGAHRSEGAMASPVGVATVGALPQRRGRASRWTTYQDARFGFALKYPTDVFVFDPAPANDKVRTFVSHDGQALLRIFAAQNSAGMSLAKYRRSVIEERYAGVVFGRTPQRRFWFVLSGTRDEMMLYERITFSCDGRSVHGWQMIYPLSERTFYDRIADEVHRNYSHGDSADAHCGGARPRTWQNRRAVGGLSLQYSHAQQPMFP